MARLLPQLKPIHTRTAQLPHRSASINQCCSATRADSQYALMAQAIATEMQNLYRGCVVTDKPLLMQALRDTPRVWAQTYLPAPLASHLPQRLLHSWARCEHLRINRISQGVDSAKFSHLPFGETLESVSRQSCLFGTLQPQHSLTHSLTHSLRVAAQPNTVASTEESLRPRFQQLCLVRTADAHSQSPAGAVNVNIVSDTSYDTEAL